MPPADLPTPEEICDFLMRFTGRDQNCSQRKWVSYGWVSKAGCRDASVCAMRAGFWSAFFYLELEISEIHVLLILV